MHYKKQGIPENGDILLCTVKKILPNSVFVILDEYDRKEGMIHISELSAGRIRNIRDFVKEGKKIVCKVLRIDRNRGHIDLSLRRVSLSVKINKTQELKQEQKAEKLLEQLAKILKIDKQLVFKEIGDKIIKEYEALAPFLRELSTNPKLIKELNLDKKYETELTKIVKERIKPPTVKKEIKIQLKSSAKDGITKIKSVLKDLKEFNAKKKYDTKISYLNAPNYRLSITSTDFQKLEKQLKDIEKEADRLIQKNKLEGTFDI